VTIGRAAAMDALAAILCTGFFQKNAHALGYRMDTDVQRPVDAFNNNKINLVTG
jgi:hypothetical protein